MASAKNKCPKCGGTVKVTADVSCSIRIMPDGRRNLVTSPKLLTRSVTTVAGYGYPYRADCVCERCGEKLKGSVAQGGDYVFETEHDF